MAKPKGPIEVKIDIRHFQETLDSWPGMLMSRTEQLVGDVKDMAYRSIVDKTPVGRAEEGDEHPGQAKASWVVVKASPYKWIIFSTLEYMRRLEVGWGLTRIIGIRKRHGGARIPLGGYAMVRNTQKLAARFIQIASANLGRGAVSQENKKAA